MWILRNAITLLFVSSCSFGGKEVEESVGMDSESGPLMSFYGNRKLGDIDEGKMRRYLKQLKGKIKSNAGAEDLMEVLSVAAPLVGTDQESRVYYQLLSQEVLGTGLNRKIPHQGMLNMALNALLNRRYETFFYFIDQLLDSGSDYAISAARNLQAILFWQRNEVASAMEAWRDAYEKNPKNSAIRINYAFALIHSGQALEAKKVLSSVSGRMPSKLADILISIDSGKAKEAKSLCRSLLKKAQRPDLLINCAVVYIGAGESSRARKLLERASGDRSLSKEMDLSISKVRRMLTASKG